MNSHLSDLWEMLEQQGHHGLVKRLYGSSCSLPIFATYNSDDGNCGIGFSFSNEIRINVEQFKNLKEMKVTVHNDSSYANHKLLIIQLLVSENKDTFAHLCENLIFGIKSITSEKGQAIAIINSLSKWRSLFDNSKTGLLSKEEQQGLYGELAFLMKFLENCPYEQEVILNYWVGTSSAIRDFQGKGWAVEVKTTSGNNASTVKINGERQLDETLVPSVFLYHYAVETSEGNGETLPQKIDVIREYLKDNWLALSIFNEKIALSGFRDDMATFYLNRCYKIREEAAYRICGMFPRIKENELRNGVCNVKYEISLAMCDEYMIPESELFKAIGHEE